LNRHSLADAHTRVVTQGLTPYCDPIVTVFSLSNRPGGSQAQADHTRERQPQTCLGMFLVMIVVNCIRYSLERCPKIVSR